MPQSPNSSGSATPQPWTSGITRHRPRLACVVCKTRKVKCDRKFPSCSRCTDAGNAAQCLYEDTPTSISRGGERTFSLQDRRRLDKLERQVARLDSKLNQVELPIVPGPLEASNPLQDPQPQRPTIQGTNFATQFYGVTHSVSCSAYFHDLVGVIQHAISNHPVLGHQPPVTLENKTEPTSSRFDLNSDIAIQLMIPNESRCRSLMESYFRHFNMTFRIVHRTTFWRRFSIYHSRESSETTSFLAVMLAAMSCSRCLEADTPLLFDSDGSCASRETNEWVEALEAWIERQSHKHTSLEMFQVKCLLMLSHKLNAIKIKRYYIMSQTLLATAISLGLHRSPNSLGVRATFYEKEMRRRLWFAVTELELAESIERGVPSLVSQLFTDIEPPGNLLDEDFDQSTEFPPVPRPDTTFTPSTLARLAQELQKLRYSVSSLANNPDKHKSLTSAELRSIHEEILRFFYVLETESLTRNQDDQAYFCKAYLELQTHSLLLILHIPFAISNLSPVVTNHSRFVCKASSRTIIQTFCNFETHALRQTCLPRTELVRATLTHCLLHSTANVPDPIYSDALTSEDSVRLVDRVFDLMEERIMALGDGFRGLWLMFAASCFLQRNQDPSFAAEWQRSVTDRVVKLVNAISVFQENPGAPGRTPDVIFATYMKHIQNTLAYAKVNKSDEAPSSTLISDDMTFLDHMNVEWSDQMLDGFGMYATMNDMIGL